MRILLLRHGQSEANVSRLMSGHSDVDLSELGIEQARRAGERLASEGISRIFSSDLLRAHKTAQLANLALGLEIALDQRLRERAWGIYEGCPVDKFIEDMQESSEPRHLFKPEGAESLMDLSARASSFLEEVVPTLKPDETILLAGHHSINKMLIKEMAGLDWDWWAENTLQNASLSSVSYRSDTPQVELFNCTLHLNNL